MDIVRATIFRKITARSRRYFAGARSASAPEILGELGARTIFAMPDPANATLFAAARRARREGMAAQVPRVRTLDPGGDSVFETLRFAFESDSPTVVWLAPGPQALAVLPALRVALRSRVPLLVVAPSFHDSGPDANAASPDTSRNADHRRLFPCTEILRPFCKAVHVIREAHDGDRLFEEAWRDVTDDPAGPVLVDLKRNTNRR